MIGAVVSEYRGGVQYRLGNEWYPLAPWIVVICEACCLWALRAWAGIGRGKR